MPESVPATETKGADFSNWDMPNITPSKEPAEAKMGDRLKSVIEDWIEDVAGVTPDGAKRPELYKHLRRVWTEAGVIGPESVLDRLNIKSTAVEATTDEVRQAQAVINAYLKAKYPDFDGVTIQQVEVFLKGLQDVPPKFLGKGRFEAPMLSGDAEKIANGEFIESVAAVHLGKPDTLKEKLLDQDKFIATLGLPIIGKRLLESIALPANEIAGEGKLSGNPNNDQVQPFEAGSHAAAYYSSKANCVTTTVIAKGSDKGADAYAKLHVVHNKQTGKSLVIAFTKPTVEMGSGSSVTVVNAKDSDAESQVKAWLGANTAGFTNDLRVAFEERNLVPNEKASASLEKLLTDQGIRPFSPTMLDGSHTASRSM